MRRSFYFREPRLERQTSWGLLDDEVLAMTEAPGRATSHCLRSTYKSPVTGGDN
jgi:hypothetical protein